MLVDLLEYARLGPRRVVVRARILSPNELYYRDVEELAENIVDYLLSMHSEELAEALTDIAERCLRKVLGDERFRQKMMRGILAEAAGEGVITITCEGDACRAEIDPERSPEPEDWSSMDNVVDLLNDVLEESDAGGELYSEVISCILSTITRAGDAG